MVMTEYWRLHVRVLLFCGAGLLFPADFASGQDARALERKGAEYESVILPLLQQYCHDCHAGDEAEAEIDLAAIGDFSAVRKRPEVWQRVRAILDSEQMPPPEAAQPTDEERQTLRAWVRTYLMTEAEAHAGDPGDVVLRRLSNSEYTYTLRDLTGVPTLDPAREFPVDGAAGEGFTNVGSGLVMSPSLVTKYLDAGKEVARHMVLLPDGIRFDGATSRRDWTDEAVTRIREFYDMYTSDGGGSSVNLQGIAFETNQGGRLPIETYLAALWEERGALTTSRKTVEQIADERGLSPKYLQLLHQTLSSDAAAESVLLARVRAEWQSLTERAGTQPEHLDRVLALIQTWQTALWKFNSVGHIGRTGGPPSWMEAVTPESDRQEFVLKLDDVSRGEDIVVYLVARTAGDGSSHDVVLWERPRLRVAGRNDLLVRDVPRVAEALASRRKQIYSSTASCLSATAAVEGNANELDVVAVAKAHGVDPDVLGAWWEYLGVGPARGDVELGPAIDRKSESISDYDFVQGWVGDDALSVVANSSDEHVRIPGNMRPHSVAVHPSPARAVCIGWHSPVAAPMRIAASIQHAHPECGNGVQWTFELRRGRTRQQLASGTSQGSNVVAVGPFNDVPVQSGDVVVLSVHPREKNHSCDLTAVDMSLSDGQHVWELSRDVSPSILASNPHADQYGNAATWHFFSEASGEALPQVVPAGSLLSRWQLATQIDERRQLAEQLQVLLQGGIDHLPADAPDAVLYRQLTSVGGPLMSSVLRTIADSGDRQAESVASPYGVDRSSLGSRAEGLTFDSPNLRLHAPEVVTIRLPGDLAVGAEFVTTAMLDPDAGREGSVQVQVLTMKYASPVVREPNRVAGDVGASESAQDIEELRDLEKLTPTLPVLTYERTDARQRFRRAFEEFRQLFPPALCYTRIVPVDEVVTLQLYYREDEHLQRLMLNDSQIDQLNRLWDELYFIAHEPIALATVFEQLSEFATQDRPDLVKAFEPLREPINQRAEQFRQRLVDTQPVHVEALIDWTERAWRRELAVEDRDELRRLYGALRANDLGHDEAMQLMLARVLTAPEFLYRFEQPVPGKEAGPVTSQELAVRLSYFLWSSVPDDELERAAKSGDLLREDVLVAQTRRMLEHPHTRRLAIEFACQWLNIRDFDQNDEKNEALYPEFVELRDDMYEESVRFFEEMFRNDRPVLELLDADYTFLNEPLAAHYGVDGVRGETWQRVEGMRTRGRGGVLGMSAVLAKQSGASRTSPILRGNWVYETLLGERLPRPPANVPVLPDEIPENLTERQLIELHSSAPGCAKCHVRIDPYGFALEQFDAIGRQRTERVDTRATLIDGKSIEGVDGLRQYLLQDRRDDFLRQFCRKLLGYALGREVQLSDEILLDQMRRNLKENEYRFSVAVETIVTSPQFRHIRGRDSVYNDKP